MNIMELKKEQDRIVIKKEQLQDSRVRLKEAVLDACQHLLESTTELDAIEREKWIGAVIAQLQ